MTFWKEVVVEVEVNNRDYRLGVEEDSTATQVINAIKDQLREDNVDIEAWAKKTVGGTSFNLVLIRKDANSAVMAPAIQFKDLTPPLDNGESFILGADPKVA